MAETQKHTLKPDAIVLDLDRTLFDGDVAKAVGYAFLKDELKAGHIGAFLRGAAGIRKVKRIVKEQGNAAGLEALYGLIGGSKGITYDRMVAATEGYISKHVRTTVKAFAESFAYEGVPMIFVTMGGTVEAIAASEVLRADVIVSNNDQFKYAGREGSEELRLVGVETVMKTAEDKLEWLQKTLSMLGKDIKNCIVIGDSAEDVEMLRAAGYPILSPMARNEVLDAMPGASVIVEAGKGSDYALISANDVRALRQEI